MSGKVIIFSAPSGAGKSTIVNHLLGKYPELEFSISATSRAPRGDEQDGREYYFFTADQFRRMIAEDKFVEHEEVYPGSFYGTLKSEVERIWAHPGPVGGNPAGKAHKPRNRLGRGHREEGGQSFFRDGIRKRQV